MRWLVLIILAFAAVLVQVTIGGLLRFRGLGIGSIGPDLVAMIAVFIAMYARWGADAMLSAWVLGLALDLTAAGGAGSETAVGPMPIASVLAAWLVYRIRGAFFRERVLAQMVLALAFCAVAHGTWVMLQCAVSHSYTTWAVCGQLLFQALALSIYTAVLMPIAHMALSRAQKLFMAGPPGRARRGAS